MLKFFITQVNGCWIIIFPTEDVFMYDDEPEKKNFIEIFLKDVVSRFAEHFHDGVHFVTMKENHHEAWFTCLPQFDQNDFIIWLKQTVIYTAGVSIGIDVVKLEK